MLKMHLTNFGMFYFLIQFRIFSSFPRDFLFEPLIIYTCVKFQVLEIFQLLFCYKFLVWFHFNQMIYFVWFQYKFVKTCFITQDKVFLAEGSLNTWKEFVFYCKSQLIQLVYGSVLLYPCYFLFTCSINYWERNVEVSKFNCGVFHFSFQFD